MGGWGGAVCCCVCLLRALHSVARVKINAAILSSVRIPPLGLKEGNSIKCSFGTEEPQRSSDDVKLPEPGGFRPPRCHRGKFVPLSGVWQKI